MINDVGEGGIRATFGVYGQLDALELSELNQLNCMLVGGLAVVGWGDGVVLCGEEVFIVANQGGDVIGVPQGKADLDHMIH